jgi:hypothetical protein
MYQGIDGIDFAISGLDMGPEQQSSFHDSQLLSKTVIFLSSFPHLIAKLHTDALFSR